MSRNGAFLRFWLLAGTALSAASAVAGELPTDPSVAHGAVGIATTGPDAMTINQSSRKAIVNWQGFSIGRDARVHINQPSASSAILNRVTGPTQSRIAGQLNATGEVYLVNPNGIVIGRTGRVQAAGFVASSLAMSDRDFKNGRRTFAGSGASAAVVNHGSIEIGRGGYAALLGGRVRNTGTVRVPMGTVAVASGEMVTLDLSGDGILQVAVPSDQEGDAALIENSGRLLAEGGHVEIKAATARDAARNAVNLSGVVAARSVGGRSGSIVLGGGDGGAVTVTGRLDTSTRRRRAAAEGVTHASPPMPRPETGGAITVTGETIRLAGATLDASGRDGGGKVQIGGDLRGGGALQRATTTLIDASSVIRADALDAGHGGTVVVWSDGFTGYAGHIAARGGPAGGDGGFAEVSGRAHLAFTGLADLSAPRGAFGTLLLDPHNVFIEEGPSTSVLVCHGGTCGDDVGPITGYEPTGDNSVINADDLVAALASANIAISTERTFPSDAPPGTQDGDITVGAPLSWAAATTLSLIATGDIILARPITASEGGLSLVSGGEITTPATWTASNGTLRSGGDGSVDVGTFTLHGGDWVQREGPLPGFAAADFRIVEGSFLRALGGEGTPAEPFLITDVFGLQGIGSSPELVRSHYALANDIDAGGTANWNLVDDDNGGSFAGFEPIGAIPGLPFSGSLDGRGRTIDSLTIQRPQEEQVGLFASTDGAVITDLDLAGVTVSGGRSTGALVGAAGLEDSDDGGAIARVRATGEVTGIASLEVGGLVGWNRSATITDSISEVAVTWIDNDVDCGLCDVGGLVGWNFGEIRRSFASGPVRAGTLATGSPLRVGGLVGANDEGGSIAQSYATGAVDVAGSSAVGLYVGGLVGENIASSISAAYATGPVTVTATGPGAPSAGGLVGRTEGGTVTASFWDMETSGQDQSAGGTGLATAEFQDTLGFMALAGEEGWDFTETWAPSSPGHYPELYALSPVVRVDIDDAARLYGEENPDFTATVYGGPDLFVFGPESDLLDVTTALGTEAEARSPVGEYAITAVEDEAVSVAGIAYRIVAIDGTLTIDPAPLIITANDATKIYGTEHVFDGTEFTPEGLVNGDTITFVLLRSDGADPRAPVAFSPYAIAAGDAVGEGLAVEGISNYDITYVDGTLTVEPAPLTITANDASKVYGNEHAFAGTEFAVDGLRNDDTVDFVLLLSPGAEATAPVGGGPYAITPSDAVGQGLVADDVFNYDIQYVDGTLTVVPRPLRIGIGDGAKIYGDAFDLATVPVDVNGLAPFDPEPEIALASDGAPSAANVAGSPYAIALATIDGPGLSFGGVANYDVTVAEGRLAVAPAPLTITALDAGKRYGETFLSLGTAFTADGLVNDDRVDSVTLESPGAAAGATVGGGPYPLTPSNAVGQGLEAGGVFNYDIDYADGALTVEPAPLTITVNDATKIYGNTIVFAGTEFTVAGLVNEDRVARLLIESAGAEARAPVAGSPYAITARQAQGSGLEDRGEPNYAIDYVPGRLTVEPARLTITADDLRKLLGRTLVFNGTEFTVVGLVPGDSVTSVSLDSPGAAAGAPVAGSPYAIRAGDPLGVGLAVDGVANYDIDFADGRLTVEPPGISDPAVGLLSRGVVGIPNFADVVLADVGGFVPAAGGQTLGTGDAVAAAEEVLAFVTRLSDTLEAAAEACGETFTGADDYLSCIRDALDAYASALDARIVDLPEPLRAVSAVIEQATRRIEAARVAAARRIVGARTEAEVQAIERAAIADARAAVGVAIEEIRKAIELIRADEPQLVALQTEQGNAITSALQSVESGLARAVGL